MTFYGQLTSFILSISSLHSHKNKRQSFSPLLFLFFLLSLLLSLVVSLLLSEPSLLNFLFPLFLFSLSLLLSLLCNYALFISYLYNILYNILFITLLSSILSPLLRSPIYTTTQPLDTLGSCHSQKQGQRCLPHSKKKKTPNIFLC